MKLKKERGNDILTYTQVVIVYKRIIINIKV